jgi:hypothetical protein
MLRIKNLYLSTICLAFLCNGVAVAMVPDVPDTGDKSLNEQLENWYAVIQKVKDKKVVEDLDAAVVQFVYQVYNTYAVELLAWLESDNINKVQKLHNAIHNFYTNLLPFKRADNDDLVTMRDLLEAEGFDKELSLPLKEKYVQDFVSGYIEKDLKREVDSAVSKPQEGLSKTLKDQLLPPLKESLENLVKSSGFKNKFPEDIAAIYEKMLDQVKKYTARLADLKENPYFLLKLKPEVRDLDILGMSSDDIKKILQGKGKLKPEAVKEVLDKAFRQRSKGWHPDRIDVDSELKARLKENDIAALKLTDDQKKKLATEGFQLIQNAYDRAIATYVGKKERAAYREE